MRSLVQKKYAAKAGRAASREKSSLLDFPRARSQAVCVLIWLLRRELRIIVPTSAFSAGGGIIFSCYIYHYIYHYIFFMMSGNFVP